MTTTVSKTEFKAHALEILRTIETTGETVVITDRGRPTVEVRRHVPSAPDALARLRGSVISYQAPTDPVLEDDAWEATR